MVSIFLAIFIDYSHRIQPTIASLTCISLPSYIIQGDTTATDTTRKFIFDMVCLAPHLHGLNDLLGILCV